MFMINIIKNIYIFIICEIHFLATLLGTHASTGLDPFAFRTALIHRVIDSTRC